MAHPSRHHDVHGAFTNLKHLRGYRLIHCRNFTVVLLVARSTVTADPARGQRHGGLVAESSDSESVTELSLIHI